MNYVRETNINNIKYVFLWVRLKELIAMIRRQWLVRVYIIRII